MATLTGKQIANSYKQLLQIGTNNDGLTSSLQTVQDGKGDNSSLQLSNSTVNINGTLALNGVNITADASALNAITNLNGVTGIVAVSAGNVNGRTLTAGTGVSITNADGTEGNPTIALNPSGATSGSYAGANTNFEINTVGQVVSIGAASSISVSGFTGTTFTGGTFAGTTGDFSSNVSVGGNLKIDGEFTPAALSVTGTINATKVSASVATFNNIVSAAFFVGDGSGLTNVPSAEGGTMKQIDAGTGIRMTVGGAVSSSIPVSGVVAVSANQNFGTVSVSTAFVATGSAVFGILSATNIDSDELLIAGVSAATVTEVAAVSALTKTNLDAITSINTVVANVSVLTSVNAAAATSINTVVAAVSALTKTNLDSITSINTVVAGVSALTSVNKAAITSINTIIGDGGDFATSAELATVSSALATSIGNSNTNIAAVSVLTSVNTAAVTSINTVVAAVSTLTKTNLDAVTSINTVVTNLSSTFATSINNSRTIITSVNNLAVAVSALTKTNLDAITSINTVVTDLSATMATSIGTRLPLAGGALTGIVSGTDFYVSAIAIGVDALLGKDIRIGTAAVADIVSLTDAASIAVNFNTGQNFAITLAGNRTLGNPANCVAGQVGSIFVVQDGTGSRTLAYGTSWDFPAGEAPTLTTDAAAVDRIDYIVHTSTDVHAVLTKAYS